MNPIVFSLLGLLLIGSATGVLLVKEPVRCALFGALAFLALGLLFIALGSEFLGLVQLLVNVGAVAILIVFVVLLTRRKSVTTRRFGPTAFGGLMTAGLLLVGMWAAVFRSPSLADRTAGEVPEGLVAAIGTHLVGSHLLPLQAAAVLLTAALIGAALFVWDEDQPDPPKPGDSADD